MSVDGLKENVAISVEDVMNEMIQAEGSSFINSRLILESLSLHLCCDKLDRWHDQTHNLERYGHRSFSAAGPSSWNALPRAIRNSFSLPAFRSSLKTRLFHEAFVTLL